MVLGTDADAFMRESRDATLVCYCRVSNAKLRDDLDRQVACHRRNLPQLPKSFPTPVSGSTSGDKGLVSLLERLRAGCE